MHACDEERLQLLAGGDDVESRVSYLNNFVRCIIDCAPRVKEFRVREILCVPGILLLECMIFHFRVRPGGFLGPIAPLVPGASWSWQVRPDGPGEAWEAPQLCNRNAELEATNQSSLTIAPGNLPSPLALLLRSLWIFSIFRVGAEYRTSQALS